MNKKTLRSHIAVGDYFGTLATILDLLRQDLEVTNEKHRNRLLRSLTADLLYLQEHYRIATKK